MRLFLVVWCWLGFVVRCGGVDRFWSFLCELLFLQLGLVACLLSFFYSTFRRVRVLKIFLPVRCVFFCESWLIWFVLCEL